MRSYYNKDKRKYREMSYETKYLLDPKYMTKRDLQYYYRYYNMKNKRRSFTKILLIIILICFISYIFIICNVRTKIIEFKSMFDRIDADYNVTQAYFVDTSGCRMPHFEVTDDNIVQFMKKPESFLCKKPLTRTLNEGAFIVLNLNKTELWRLYNIKNLSSVNCIYTQIIRINDTYNEYTQKVPFKLNLDATVEVKPGFEFIRVNCYDRKGEIIYNDFHFFVIEKSHNDNNAFQMKTIKPTSSNTSKVNFQGNYEHVNFNRSTSDQKQSNAGNHKSEHLSVMLLGIDTLSHLNFLRQMQNSAKFIKNKLRHVEYWGFNKVGYNTYPNLVPLFSGLDVNELNISCLAGVKYSYFDNCSFLWKRFRDAGFKTVFAEDVADLGLFNYLNTGFKRQPTDYYLRPIMVEMERHIASENFVNVNLCMGGRCTADVVLEYALKFIPLMLRERFFSFFWTVTITHDDFNMPVMLDNKFLRLLEAFESSGVFNNTLIFVLSDHGLRWGSFRNTYQGMMEERQPLLMALYPKWFKFKYPAAVANLELNARRLTTHFDLHATLLDLVNLHNLQNKKIADRAADLADSDILPRGISLFLPIPKTRTCEHAGIASHWCSCYERREMPTNDDRVQRAARYIVNLINKRLMLYPQCRRLFLHSIMTAYIAAPHHKIVQDITNEYAVDITLRLQTKPGLGQFESTVRMSSYRTSLTGTISRINLYASQSYCINNYALKSFCYCYR